MASFSYQLVDRTGTASSGVIDAPSLAEASRMLRRDSATLVDLRPAAAARPAYQPRPRKIKLDDVLFFSNQIAVMVDTGVPLLEALDCIAQQTPHTGLKALVGALAEDIRSGSDFSTALAKHPRVFGTMYVSMIRASEMSGTMGAMLERISRFLSEQRELRRQVKGAMMYPVGVLCFSVTMLVLMMVFILPRFEKIYASKKAALPLATRILLGVSDVIVHQWPWLLAGAAAATAGLWWALRTEGGRLLLDTVKLRLPLLGGMYQKLFISRAFRTLATMLASGVEVLDAIAIAAEVIGNRLHRAMWLTLAERLREGGTISDEMFRAPLIPRQMAQMVSSGDRSGRMADVLERISDFCDADVKVTIKALTSLLEPIMIVVMGALVGGIAMALLLPIFSISKVMH